MLSVIGAADAEQWDFRAYLDDKPIGTHHFSVTAHGAERTVRSQASFQVKVLGITVYRYQHDATEHWRGDCLRGLESTTNDDGKHLGIHLAPSDLEWCELSYAYWNPHIFQQSQLLNPQTGRFDAVDMRSLGQQNLLVHGALSTADGWRINRADGPIDVWYSPYGDWIGLDSTISGGHKLSYRLP